MSNKSSEAMNAYVASSPGLGQPLLSVKVPGTPTLPDLKMLARRCQEEGQQIVDQSAGDIDEVGQPLSQRFLEWVETTRDELVGRGHDVFARTPGSAFDFPDSYQPQYPIVVEALAKSWGIRQTDFLGVHTLSGRTAIDLALRGLIAAYRERGGQGKMAVILDPLAWPGYGPLTDALDVERIHAPANPAHGLGLSPESLKEAITFAKKKELSPIAAIPIIPSNPTGVGPKKEILQRYIEAAAKAQLPVLIDAFYSPLAQSGHAQAIPMAWLEENLSPEVLSWLGMIVGETKVTSSQNKTATLFWMAPKKRDSLAKTITTTAVKRKRATNSYPRPREALVAYALHTFPGGIHEAMGPRYRALDATRMAMREVCDSFGLPLSIGGSFYGTVALVGDDRQSLVRDRDGRPVTDPAQMSDILIKEYGLVGAPGSMFSPAPEAAPMLRLTAAVTLEEVKKVGAIFARMIEVAKKAG